MLISEANVRLVNERGRLQRVIRALLTEVGSRPLPKVLIDERHEAFAGVLVAFAPGAQQRRDIGLRSVVHGFVRGILTVVPAQSQSVNPPMREFRGFPRVTVRRVGRDASNASDDATYGLVPLWCARQRRSRAGR